MDTTKVELQEVEEGSYAITALSIVGLGFILAGWELSHFIVQRFFSTYNGGDNIVLPNTSLPSALYWVGAIISALCLLLSKKASHVWLTRVLSGLGVVIVVALMAFPLMVLFLFSSLGSAGNSW